MTILNQKLPVDDIVPQALALLESNQSLILQATPGSGKTTRIPPALLKSAFRGDKEILVLEPRRLAAKWAARRVAQELGEEVGKTVGYQFRFENVSSAATRLKFLTEGMLMRRLLNDRNLKDVAAVILDEFHERHLHGDIALAYLRHLQKTSRPDLKIVLMSATLETQNLSQYLEGAPILNIDAQLFPIKIEHLPSAAAKPLEIMVRDAVGSAISDKGDVLVFLPGMAEIRRAAEALESIASRHGLLILPLHGELSREEQDRAIQKADRQKVVLSTNVAETSLTIDGVTTVVDSGLHRMASYSWWSGVPALRTRPISRASGIQRAGRAGRTAPGRCLRLYTKGDFDGRAPFETPEIRRADLTQTYLELKSLNIAEPEKFGWFEAPAAQSLEASRTLLYKLGALDSTSGLETLSAIGRRMVELPAHPRIARMLIEAEKSDVLSAAATFAALISEGRLEELDALAQLERMSFVDDGLKRTRQHLLGGFRSKETAFSKLSADQAKKLRFAVLTGFPDRVAKKRNEELETELIFSSGSSARIENSGIVREGSTFVTLDIQEQQNLGQARSKLKVRALVGIEPEWLFDLSPSPIDDREEITWDAAREQVVRISKMTYDQITLTESRGEIREEDEKEASRVLLKNILGIEPERIPLLTPNEWVKALSSIADAELIEGMFARMALVAKFYPDFGLKDLDLTQAFRGKRSLDALRKTDWANELLSGLDPSLHQKFEQLVPTNITLPNGRRPKINYKLDQAPWVESRMQDFFGVKTALTILGGRYPLTLHLLAPNMRAVQVTTDLLGFWDRAYAEVRRELARKYPRHAWPENPREAEPIIKPPRRH